jgi:eukaryotic-like serine/threonine-protein kinase
MLTTQNVGPYEVLQLLAAGGMAEVFLARKGGPGGFEKQLVIKRVAKKLLGDREIEDMFLDEARVHARLDHPNIVQIYDFGEDKGSYYIAMELVAGATLRWVIDNATAVRRPMPVPHALRIASDVLAGLHCAHELTDAQTGAPLHLIHRDISPVNILVARSGQAKVCDFGVAKSAVQRVLTRVGIVKGKFRYMSPEQLNGEPLDRRADLFAVGVCLWELLVGRRLFDDGDEAQVVSAIRGGDYPSPSAFRADVPRALDRVLRRALAPDRDHRFKSARAFQLACEELLRLLPRSSNAVLLGEYLGRELDGIAGLAADRGRLKAPESDSLVGTGFEALDPPVPLQPTWVGPMEDSGFEEEDAETLPQPSPAGRLLSALLMAPALAFAGCATAYEAIRGARRPRADDPVKLTRTTFRE